MLSRDLIASIVRTFFEELDDVRDGRKGDNTAVAYADLYSSYFKQDRAYFVDTDIRELTTFFSSDPIQKLEMLAELMYRDAKSFSDPEICSALYRRTVELYEIIDSRSQDFSLERMNRIGELKNKLDA